MRMGEVVTEVHKAGAVSIIALQRIPNRQRAGSDCWRRLFLAEADTSGSPAFSSP